VGRSFRCAIATFLAAATVPAFAQSDYPQRGIRIIYGFAAGTDVVVRLLADKLADVLGKPVTVDKM
jgi:tripartite-type tricarboxylate transporter receptor subunit TctC